MANYADSRRDAIRYKLNERMNMPEFKYKPSPVVEMLLNNRDFLLPAKEQARIMDVKNSDQDTVYTTILDKQAVSVGSARAYNHTGSINDSTKTAITFITRAADFTYSVKQADRDSIFTLAEMVSAQLLSHIIGIHENIETYMLAILNTNKSQVSNTPTLGTWDSSNYVYQVANSDKNVFFQRLKGFMRENYYRGTMQMVGNEPLYQWAEWVANQGAGNSNNLNFTINGITNYTSTELTNGTGVEGTGYIMPVGTAGMLNWIPNLNRQGFGDTFKVGGLYYSIPDPFGTGLTFAVHEYAAGADNNSAAGETQDINIHVEVSTDVAPVIAPMTTSNASPIYKVELLA